jgi:hypothetical protein
VNHIEYVLGGRVESVAAIAYAAATIQAPILCVFTQDFGT